MITLFFIIEKQEQINIIYINNKNQAHKKLRICLTLIHFLVVDFGFYYNNNVIKSTNNIIIFAI